MGTKLNPLKGNMQTPGAGTYEPDPTKVMKGSPMITMKTKLTSDLDKGKSLGPGPGGYEVHLKNKRDAPKFGFGSSQRGSNEPKSISPGPGAYKINTKVGDVPSYAIPGRTDA